MILNNVQHNERTLFARDAQEAWLMDAVDVGMVELPNGRRVWNTGRVAIGRRHDARPDPRDPGVSAERVQRALLPPAHDQYYDALRYSYSAITHVGRSRRERIVNAIWWVVGVVLVVGMFGYALFVDASLSRPRPW